ncbi:MAG TPA: PDZ domain-containing protein [Clostridiaceae bacterium]|nr:PDZ domain-containing protein [Clostridiaceae bacterium]
MPVLTILSYVARELLSSLILNYKLVPVYIIIILLIKTQYERHRELNTDHNTNFLKSLWEIFEETIFFGIVVGFIAGFIMVSIGITLDSKVFEYLLMIMAFLMLFNIRFICLSYAAGLLALISIVFHLPGINVTHLLALIAIVHLFEGILVLAGAGKDCMPVYIKYDTGIAGAFLTKRFWPVPIIFLTFITQQYGNIIKESIEVNWWTLFNPEIAGTGTIAALGLDCAISVLCYTDIAITKQPDKKSREMGIQFLLYSVILFLIAVFSRYIYFFKIIGAVFAIVTHEFIVLYSRYRERHGTPMFVPVRRGIRVLDIPIESHAFKMGMKRGDIILSINGKDVQTEDGIAEALRDFPTFIWIDAVDVYGKKKEYEYKCYPKGINNLGVMIIPRESEVTYNIDYYENYSVIKNLVRRFRGNSRSI